jgi:outer membrane protein assembly factor BamB
MVVVLAILPSTGHGPSASDGAGQSRAHSWTFPSANVPAPAGDDWPAYLHDAERSASAENDSGLAEAAITSLASVWQGHTASPISASATVANGTVYVGSWSGYEYAFNATTGAVVWQTFLGLGNDSNCTLTPSIGVSSTAAVAGGTVYVAGGDATFYALSAANGTVEWSQTVPNRSTGDFLWSSPLLADGAIYIGVASQCDAPLVISHLLEIDPVNGTINRSFQPNPPNVIGASIWGSATFDPENNSIYFGTGNGGPGGDTVFGLNATTLAVEGNWTVPPSQQISDGDFGNTPTLFTNGHGARWFAIANKNGILYAFNESQLASGPVWESRIAVGGAAPERDEGSVSPGTFYDGRLYAAGGKTSIDGKNCSGSVRSFNPWNGSVLWQYCAPGDVLGALASANGMVFAGAGSTLVVLNATSGVPLWSQKIGARIYAAPSVAEGRLFVSTVAGRLVAFGERNATLPPLVANASSAYDPAAREVLLFGGCEYPACPGAETWAFRYGLWHNLTPVIRTANNSPSPRSDAAMVWDSASGRVVLFGGRSVNGGVMNDTWEFGPAGWSRVPVVVSPPARTEAGFAMDASTKEAILFGGLSGGISGPAFLNDTWSFNGTAWSNVTVDATMSPPARASAVFVANATPGVLLLFGGLGVSGILGDTWEYSAGNWKELAPTESPPPTYAAGASYDAATGSVLVVGGMEATGPVASVWSFSAGNWSEIAIPSKAAPRSAAALSYVTGGGFALLYGGRNTAGLLLGDAWKIFPGKWVPVVVRV